MKAVFLILAVGVPALQGISGEKPRAQSETNGVVFRAPFTLKLHEDKEHYYEQDFVKIPYVYQDEVYLFKGDAFGIDLKITNGVVRGITYQADTSKAAVSFRFKQEVRDGEEKMMVLMIDNHTKNKLFMDALMTVPKGGKPRKTLILPLEPDVSGYESWPYAIVRLVLRDIRFAGGSKAEPGGGASGSK
jgi:hypothetical protein